MSEIVSFGMNITLFNFVNYFHRNLDNVLIGRFVGTEALGIYSRAFKLLMFPIRAIRMPLNSVAFPAMSKLKDEHNILRIYYMRTIGIIAFFTMPLVAYCFVTSEAIVEVALGKQWLECSPVFSVLAITAFIQPVVGMRGTVMMSCGNGGRFAAWGILNSIVVSIGFLIAVQWGTVAVAISLAITTYALVYPSLMIAFFGTAIRIRDFNTAIWRPTIASITAGLVAAILKALMHFENPLYLLMSCGLIFAVAFLACYSGLPGGLNELARYRRLSAKLWSPPVSKRHRAK